MSVTRPVIKTIKNRYTEIVTRNLVKVRIPRPCSPIWDKWNDSSGQTPCPCPTCPTKVLRPPSPCPICPAKIWRPPSPCPLVPRTPTCPNLSHLVVPLVLSQLYFLGYFFGVSHCHSISRKTHPNEKSVSKYYHVGEGMNNKQISRVTKRKYYTLCVSLTHCHIPRRESHHKPFRDTSLARRIHEAVVFRSLLWLLWI